MGIAVSVCVAFCAVLRRGHLNNIQEIILTNTVYRGSLVSASMHGVMTISFRFHLRPF